MIHEFINSKPEDPWSNRAGTVVNEPRRDGTLRQDTLLEFWISAFLRTLGFGPRILLLSCLLTHSMPSSAQPTTTIQDPMMQLMLAQPKIDVESPVIPVVSFDPAVIKPGEE